jgi:hypothetical protein
MGGDDPEKVHESYSEMGQMGAKKGENTSTEGAVCQHPPSATPLLYSGHAAPHSIQALFLAPASRTSPAAM